MSVVRKEKLKKMKKRDKFIVFEGGEGSGKTTVARFILQTLENLGLKTLLTHEPGGTKLGTDIRKILLYGENMHPRTELLLFLADRAEHVERTIKPALAEGKIVICDRFDGSTFAYQGGARAVDFDLTLVMNAFAKDNLVPDLYILFDVSPEIGLNREGKNVTRFEKEELDIHRRIRRAYLSMARNDDEHWAIVDAEQPLEDVKQKVLEIFKKRKII